MPRKYSCSFKNVTIAAAQDLITLFGGTNKLCMVERVWLAMNDTTLQTAQGLRLNVKFGPATITPGSGGSAVTPQPFDPGDPSAVFTARANDTTKTTTSSTFRDIAPWGGHNYSEVLIDFKKDGPLFGEGQAVIFELLSTVVGTCNFSGGADVIEWG